MPEYSFTLLSVEEFLEHKKVIPIVTVDWWLKDAGYNSSTAFFIHESGTYGCCDYIRVPKGIRPVMNIEHPEEIYDYGQTIIVGAYSWTVLESNSEKAVVLCTDIVIKNVFDSTHNSFNQSDINALLKSNKFKSLIFNPECRISTKNEKKEKDSFALSDKTKIRQEQFRKALANTVRKKRTESKISKKQFAKELGLTMPELNKIENCDFDISVFKTMFVLDGLGVGYSFDIDGDNQESPPNA